MSALILEEVNVKRLEFVEDDNLLHKKVVPNFRLLGKKYGKLMKELASAIKSMSQDEIRKLENDGSYTIHLSSCDAVVTTAEVEIVNEDIPGYAVTNDGNLTVALDLNISEELRVESLARELVKYIQTYRKESGMNITDRINVAIERSETAEKIVSNFGQYLATQVLADNGITLTDSLENGVEKDLGGAVVNVRIEKITTGNK